jgi:hypothetical protein
MSLAMWLGAAALLAGCQPAVEPAVTPDTTDGPRVVAASDIEAGRYLVLVGGCNDCHTPQYAMTNGAQPPEAEWLRGSTEGHTGPWGTTYGKNLRMTVGRMGEDQWVSDAEPDQAGGSLRAGIDRLRSRSIATSRGRSSEAAA